LHGGGARTKKIAAEKFGHISREYFARSFQNPAVAQYAKEAAARAVAMGAPRAAAVLNELADSSSERVRLEAAKASLQAAGIVGGDRNVSVNVGIEIRPAG
jgi:HEAT repeat protein